MKRTLFLAALLLIPAWSLGEPTNEDQAVSLLHAYYGFIDSFQDMPNAQYRADDRFAAPDADYMGPGGDSESYLIADKDYEVVGMETKKDHPNDRNFLQSEVVLTLRFKTYGILDLFKDGFYAEPGTTDITFDCAREKGKYCILDLSNENLRFYDSAVDYLKRQAQGPPESGMPDLGSRWKSELKALRKAHKNN